MIMLLGRYPLGKWESSRNTKVSSVQLRTLNKSEEHTDVHLHFHSHVSAYAFNRDRFATVPRNAQLGISSA